MHPHKENRIKSNCFKAAANIYAATLEKGEGIDFTDHSATIVYSIAIKLLNNGKDRYWKGAEYPSQYEHRFLKRVYIWLKERFWEKKKEVDKHGKRDI